MKTIIDYDSPLSSYTLGMHLTKYINDNLIIVCIGTDKFIGDALGPIVGSILTYHNFPFPIYGTIHSPIHALNLNSSLSKIQVKHPNSFILAIDACLGTTGNKGDIHLRSYPLHPGKGVGKKLRDVGNISIVGIVDLVESDDFLTSNSIRLSFIYDLANTIAKGILNAYLNKKSLL